MTDTPTSRSRDELLQRSRDRHAQLEALLAQLTDDDLTRPGVTDDWSAKDHLAHLTWWESNYHHLC